MRNFVVQWIHSFYDILLIQFFICGDDHITIRLPCSGNVDAVVRQDLVVLESSAAKRTISEVTGIISIRYERTALTCLVVSLIA